MQWLMGWCKNGLHNSMKARQISTMIMFFQIDEIQRVERTALYDTVANKTNMEELGWMRNSTWSRTAGVTQKLIQPIRRSSVLKQYTAQTWHCLNTSWFFMWNQCLEVCPLNVMTTQKTKYFWLFNKGISGFTAGYFFEEGLEKLVTRCEKCFNNGGNYARDNSTYVKIKWSWKNYCSIFSKSYLFSGHASYNTKITIHTYYKDVEDLYIYIHTAMFHKGFFIQPKTMKEH